MSKFCVAIGLVLNNKIQGLMLDGLLGGKVGILNSYTFNEVTKRCKLWDYLNDSLPRDYRWIMGNNFNMVENPTNKHIECKNIISGSEILTLRTFKIAL